MLPHVGSKNMPGLAEFIGVPQPRQRRPWQEAFRDMERVRIGQVANQQRRERTRSGPRKKPKTETERRP